MKTYKETLETLSVLVRKYPEVRRTGSPSDIQSLRDEISEELFWFGPCYAETRAAAERAEADYKACIEEKRKYWRNKFAKERGTAAMVDAEAFLDCRDLQAILINKNEDFYLAKSLIERVDQVLNSISSRLKLVIKHE